MFKEIKYLFFVIVIFFFIFFTVRFYFSDENLKKSYRSISQLDEKIKPQAHSDYVIDYIDTYGHEVDIMVEAKHKELAVNKYKELHNVL